MAYPRHDAVLRFLREGWFEYGEMAAFARSLRPGDQVLDIGAHCGLYSAIASNILGEKADVIALEPNARLHPFLKANLAPEWTTNSRPQQIDGRGLVCAAVGVIDGTAQLYVGGDEHTAYGTIVSPSHEPDTTDERVRTEALDVPVIEFSKLLATFADRSFVFAKVDIEGLEFDLFESVQSFLESSQNFHFQIEFDEANYASAGRGTRQLADLISSLGFEFLKFDARKQTLVPFEGDFPLWNTNLIATKEPDLLQNRVQSAKQQVVEITTDLVQRGEACNQIYLKREEIIPLKNELVATIETAHKMHAAMEARPISEDEARDLHSVLMRTGNEDLVDKARIALGKVGGAARGVTDQLNRANQKLGQIHDMKSDLASTVETVMTMHAAMEGRTLASDEISTMRASLESADYKRLVAIAQDNLGRLSGAAKSVTEQLDSANAIINAIDVEKRSIEEWLPVSFKRLVESAFIIRRNLERQPTSDDEVAAFRTTIKSESPVNLSRRSDEMMSGLRIAGDRLLESMESIGGSGERAMQAEAKLTGILEKLEQLQHDLAQSQSESELSPQHSKPSGAMPGFAHDQAASDKDVEALIALIASRARGQMEAYQRAETELERATSELSRLETLLSNNHVITSSALECLENARETLATLLFSSAANQSVMHDKLQTTKENLNRIQLHLTHLLNQMQTSSTPHPHQDQSSEASRELQRIAKHFNNRISDIGAMIGNLSRSRWISLGDKLGTEVSTQLVSISDYAAQAVAEFNAMTQSQSSGSKQEDNSA
ncbi:MAG: FkbM family methyltransferase [Ahrensia sp.]|nr:FkbM family methyltransferase [Ahrensia sp.]